MLWERFIRISPLPTYFRRMDVLWRRASRLAFITVVQFLEGLPDRQAAEAVRGRIDLKYALGLELSDPGFDFTLLSDFRKRLLEGGAEQVLLDAMLAVFQEQGWLKPRQRQRTDSTHVQDRRASHQSPHVRWRGHALCPQQPRCWSFRVAAGA
jgi:Transposase domain (DUF772)